MVKIGRAVPKICSRTDKHTQTDALITILRSPIGGGVIRSILAINKTLWKLRALAGWIIAKFHYTGPTGPDQTKSADFFRSPTKSAIGSGIVKFSYELDNSMTIH